MTLTEKLKLLLIDKIVDGESNFDTDTMLNDNWKKIDSFLKEPLNILALIKAVDGSGSGLDADLLDGAQKDTDVTLSGNSNNSIPTEKAVKTFVETKISNLIDSSPKTLDTLNELAAALGDDPNFATTMTNNLATKLSKVEFENAKSTDTNLGTSNEKIPTQNAVKEYVDYRKVPVGAVFWIAGTTVPDGFLECNGTNINKKKYAELYSVIGDTFKSTTSDFYLPDLRGEFIRGWDHGRDVDSGREFGSWQEDMFKSHKHQTNSTRNLCYSGGGGRANDATGEWTEAGAIFNTSSTGGIETRPRNMALMPIIKY